MFSYGLSSVQEGGGVESGVSSSSYKDIRPNGLGPAPMTTVKFISLKVLFPNTITLEIRASTYDLGGTQFSP